jgi:hypothetical protein
MLLVKVPSEIITHVIITDKIYGFDKDGRKVYILTEEGWKREIFKKVNN